MPFDPAPISKPQVKTGPYQHYADALLRGCAVTYQIRGAAFDYKGGACAIGAISVGFGAHNPMGSNQGDPCSWVVCSAYQRVYGDSIVEDNDQNGLTREQIAARIAAL